MGKSGPFFLDTKENPRLCRGDTKAYGVEESKKEKVPKLENVMFSFCASSFTRSITPRQRSLSIQPGIWRKEDTLSARYADIQKSIAQVGRCPSAKQKTVFPSEGCVICSSAAEADLAD